MPAMTGRCFAPPITEANLRDWPSLFVHQSSHVRGVVAKLRNLVMEARDGDGSLAAPPTAQERKDWGELFDTIKSTIPRNAAFHLLWAVNEIALGRMPTFA